MGAAKLKTEISEAAEFRSIEPSLPLDEIYRRVKFEISK